LREINACNVRLTREIRRVKPLVLVVSDAKHAGRGSDTRSSPPQERDLNSPKPEIQA
jgi:hypothetical protein